MNECPRPWIQTGAHFTNDIPSAIQDEQNYMMSSNLYEFYKLFERLPKQLVCLGVMCMCISLRVKTMMTVKRKYIKIREMLFVTLIFDTFLLWSILSFHSPVLF